MKSLIAAVAIGLSLACAPAASAAGTLGTAALAFVPYIEQASGLQIAILERIDDTQEFWARTAAILCDKTGDDWCSENVQFMTSNTEPSGQDQIIQYTPAGGTLKQVCALLPPMDEIDPSYVSEAFGYVYQGPDNYPTVDEMYAWLILYHAAHCLDNTSTVNA